MTLLTMEEAAAVFRMSRRTFQEAVAKLPRDRAWYISAGRRKLFDTSDIERIKRELQSAEREKQAKAIERAVRRETRKRRRPLISPTATPAERTNLALALAMGRMLPFERKGVPKPKADGFVYLISRGEFVKIGFSRNVALRLKRLQTAAPDPMALLKKIPGSIRDEQALHRRFAEYRTQGEWFRREGALAAWIERGCRS